MSMEQTVQRVPEQEQKEEFRRRFNKLHGTSPTHEIVALLDMLGSKNRKGIAAIVQKAHLTSMVVTDPYFTVGSAARTAGAIVLDRETTPYPVDLPLYPLLKMDLVKDNREKIKSATTTIAGYPTLLELDPHFFEKYLEDRQLPYLRFIPRSEILLYERHKEAITQCERIAETIAGQCRQLFTATTAALGRRAFPRPPWWTDTILRRSIPSMVRQVQERAQDCYRGVRAIAAHIDVQICAAALDSSDDIPIKRDMQKAFAKMGKDIDDLKNKFDAQGF